MTAPPPDDALSVLQALEEFRVLPPGVLASLAAAMELLAIEPGQALVRQGAEGDAMYMVKSGQFRVEITSASGSTAVVNLIGPGDCVGEIQLFTGGRRSASVIAEQPSIVYRLPSAALDALAEESWDALAQVHGVVRRRLLRGELSCVLSSIIGTVDHEVLDEFERVATWVSLRRGEALFRQGDPGDAWYVVVSGRLQVVRRDEQGREKTLGEVGRGEGLGELSLLTDEPRSATPYAVRDTELMRIEKEDFHRILLRYPELLRWMAKTLIQRSFDPSTYRAPLRSRLNVAVVGASPGDAAPWLAARLAEAFARTGSVLHLSSERVAALGILAEPGRLGPSSPAWLRFSRFLEDESGRHDLVLLEADRGLSPWTRQVVQQADVILIVADAAHDRGLGANEAALLDGAHPIAHGARRVLVVVHPETTVLPRGTAALLDARPQVDAHHHVRRGRQADVDRLARNVAGRALGLVLGGGGARGFAHLGVIRAMQELGLPIDYVGGTSMGSVVGAMYALGIGLDEAWARGHRVMAQEPFSEYTLPFVSLVRSRRLDACMEMAYGDAAIEDLWTPYFCVSANLTTAQLVVHRRGLVRHGVRASIALPGIVLPVQDGDSLLVDGGVLDNLPGAVMRELAQGHVIAVDVGSEEDVAAPEGGIASPWKHLWRKIAPGDGKRLAPTIGDILIRSLVLSSVSRTYQVRRQADLYLRVPIDAFGLLEFDKMDQIGEVGYAHALKELPAFCQRWEAR